jgi:hypothetical protein
MRSLRGGQRKFDPARDDMVEIGDSELMPIAEALATGFEAAFQSALESFAQDTGAESPSGAHKECWPSAREFPSYPVQGGPAPGSSGRKNISTASPTRIFVSLRKSSSALPWRTWPTRRSDHPASLELQDALAS